MPASKLWNRSIVETGNAYNICTPIRYTVDQGSNFIAAIAVEGGQNAVDHCGNDGNLLPYSAIFILFTVHYNNYFDT